ncbi:MAG: ZIP family metal transporter [Pseudobutyrivibrio sp.]|nr:ZIP family metal transporter [Pseudobutyrivibrio sp.]
MVFIMKREMSPKVGKCLAGFAAGVMVAASVWSLIIPALEQASDLGKFSFIPAVVGFWLGTLFLLGLDSLIPHLHVNEDKPEGLKANFKKTTMMVLAVTLHNIPEGMAVGVVYAGWLNNSMGISASAAFSLALGIAIQNFPEGTIISMPLHSNGESKGKACLAGVLSGLVEPIGTVITILFAGAILPFLPYLLTFAAGAMFYVVIEELVPEMSEGDHSNLATILFTAGFTLMMVLDVALG